MEHATHHQCQHHLQHALPWAHPLRLAVAIFGSKNATLQDGQAVELLELCAHLRSRLQDEEEHLAAAARLEGETWAAIADSLGVSRQAAQQRFSVRQVLDGAGDPELPYPATP
jgi:hypothetical protein